MPASVVVTPPNIAVSGGCLCCTGTGTVCDCSCCAGEGYWTEYLFTVTGIGENPPPGTCNCSEFNGTFRVRYTSACTWETSELTAGGVACNTAGLVKWRLSCSGGTWTLSNDFMGAVYSGDEGVDFVGFCRDGGGLLGGPTGIPCQNFAGPFTVTVHPAGVWVDCGSTQPSTGTGTGIIAFDAGFDSFGFL